MATISDAIVALGCTDFMLAGEPTTETEFNTAFEGINGQDVSGITWSTVSEKKAELEAAEPMRLLRAERNRLLSETDWWVLPDRTPTQAQLDYRQALRDITDTYTSLEDVVWPVKPE
jgi:hypothetical protein